MRTFAFVSNAAELYNQIKKGYIDPGQWLEDFMSVTKSERLKLTNELLKIAKDETQSDGKVVVELVYPKDERTDRDQEAA